MRLAEPQAAPLTRDVRGFLALVGSAVAGKVVVVVALDPLLVVVQVLELRGASLAAADLVVVRLQHAVVSAERLTAVDALADGASAARASKRKPARLVRALRVADENIDPPGDI